MHSKNSLQWLSVTHLNLIPAHPETSETYVRVTSRDLTCKQVVNNFTRRVSRRVNVPDSTRPRSTVLVRCITHPFNSNIRPRKSSLSTLKKILAALIDSRGEWTDTSLAPDNSTFAPGRARSGDILILEEDVQT